MQWFKFQISYEVNSMLTVVFPFQISSQLRLAKEAVTLLFYIFKSEMWVWRSPEEPVRDFFLDVCMEEEKLKRDKRIKIDLSEHKRV